jgi:aspartate kinase
MSEGSMKVAKFGGSSLADADQIKKVCGIILEDKKRKIIVVSAPGKRKANDTKMTDLLIACADSIIRGRSGKDEFDRVMDRFEDIIVGLCLDSEILEIVRKDIAERLDMPVVPEGRFMDTMKAAGEDNTAKIVAAYLRSAGAEASYADPGQAGMILTEEYGNACVLKSSYLSLARLKDRSGIIVFPGFFGCSEKGEVVTFPRGGSDITGAIIAAAVGAECYENFTDVDSVFAADPRIIDDPVGIREFTYREMRELSYAGFSVLHEESLEPVYKAHIPVWIKNTNNPGAAGTQILPERELISEQPVVGIAADGGFVSVYISKYLMNREVGFGRKVLQILEELSIPYEHMPSGIDNISIILRSRYFTAGKEIEFKSRLKMLEVDEVSVQRNLSIVMIVGEGMLHRVGIAGRAACALADAKVNIHMINQGSSEVSIMFGVLEKEAQTAVRALYNEFFPV